MPLLQRMEIILEKYVLKFSAVHKDTTDTLTKLKIDSYCVWFIHVGVLIQIFSDALSKSYDCLHVLFGTTVWSSAEPVKMMMFLQFCEVSLSDDAVLEGFLIFCLAHVC